MFKLIILLYFLAALVSLILFKYHKLSNTVSNILCIVAAVLGIIASSAQLFSDSGAICITILTSPIPYISLDLVVDRLAAFFVLALSALVLCVSLYSIGYNSGYYGKRNVGLFNFLYTTFILSMLLVVTAGNAVFFLIAWETMSLLSYFLVVFETEKKENQRAGVLYIIMTHIGTAFLFIGIMLMFSYTGSFNLFGSSAAIPEAVKNAMFILFLIGFGTKAGMIPLHIWLPYAHPAASSNVSALMSGIMIKTAIYGLARFVLFYLQIQHLWWGILLLVIGIVSSVLGVAYALMENDIKRLLAFSSIENIGIILIGFGVSFIAVAQGSAFLAGLALAASLFHTFNHTLFKGGLFLGAGAIQYSTQTKDIEKLGGLIKKLPVAALFMLCFVLAISAIVPLNGFVSEWLTYQALFLNILPGQAAINIISILSVAALALCGALAAACFVKLFGVAFLGAPRSRHVLQARKIPLTMNLGMGILAGLCLLAGVIPIMFLKMIDGVVLDLTATSVVEQLQGGLFVVYYPFNLNVAGNAISPAIVLLALVAIIAATVLLMKVAFGGYVERKTGTWDCGFIGLTPRMQYSSTGFAKPFRIIFRILYRPKRDCVIEKGQSPYFPASVEYKVSADSVFEKYLYSPVLSIINKVSAKAKLTIQTGSIHLYLSYILITMLVLLLYNRLA